MYFNQMMFHPQYVNQSYYYQMQSQIAQYNFQQRQEVANAMNAVRDLCKAVKKLDEPYQQEAFYGCLSVMAAELGWNNR